VKAFRFGSLACRAVAVTALAFGFGCASAPIHVAALDEVERVRATPAVTEASKRAAEVFARAEREREFARAAHASGDDVAATLHADRAIAAYGHTLSVARLAEAIAELADAQKSLDDATAEEQSLAVSRAKLELEAEELERRAQIARERLLPARSGDASNDRAAARLSAARALALEARLLCGAAHLVAAGTAGLPEAEDRVAKLAASLANPPARVAKPQDTSTAAVIDDAGEARTDCLRVLTKARRAAGEDGAHADALLSELSASGGWDPTRDERGIVVTLRGVFQGAKLTDDGAAKLVSLGRVASAHPGFAVQVVMHDARSLSPNDDDDTRRASAAVKALLEGGALAARVKAELAGTGAPVVDPSDGRVRERNERLDVVFVAGS
jgi:hypothetical protein